jgi:hypothetical protein
LRAPAGVALSESPTYTLSNEQVFRTPLETLHPKVRLPIFFAKLIKISYIIASLLPILFWLFWIYKFYYAFRHTLCLDT